MNGYGLKDHEIALLVNAVTAKLRSRFSALPQCLREIVRESVIDELERQQLRIDNTTD